jgi:hypothetical protein
MPLAERSFAEQSLAERPLAERPLAERPLAEREPILGFAAVPALTPVNAGWRNVTGP